MSTQVLTLVTAYVDLLKQFVFYHSGDLVAGVVGSEKFSYDVWGDTVNTASRLESSGVAGRINISGATYELVKHFFECECRGKIAAKNKGEIDMYFVNGIRPELATDSRTPNEKFYELYERLSLARGSHGFVVVPSLFYGNRSQPIRYS